MSTNPVQVVASIVPRSVEAGRALAHSARMRGADCIEFRLDRWKDPSSVAALLRGSAGPTITACRVPSDGGTYEGDADERRRLLQAAVEAGTTWIDLEHWEPYCPPRDSGVRVLRSFHRLGAAPRDLVGIVDRMAASEPDMMKVTLRAYDAADLESLLEVQARRYRMPLVAFLAGEPGLPSRFLAVLSGAPFIYCRAANEVATAPGQPDLFEAIERYRVRTLRQRARFWGLAGSPVAHSLGMRLHNHLVRYIKSAPTYLPFDTKEPERLLKVLEGYGPSFAGLSVTAPLKQAFAAHCDSLSNAARRCGAVNTVVFDGSKLRGENSDVVGIRGALREALPSATTLHGKRALVVGGGGSARAAVVALQDLEAEVALAVRTRQGIRTFAEAQSVPLFPIDGKAFEAFAPDVIVHATPVGQGDPRGVDGACIIEERWLRPGMIVLDLVYTPVLTPLIARAMRVGAHAVTGLAMFLHQAREQIRLVLDQRPPSIAELRRLLGPLGHQALVYRGRDDD